MVTARWPMESATTPAPSPSLFPFPDASRVQLFLTHPSALSRVAGTRRRRTLAGVCCEHGAVGRSRCRGRRSCQARPWTHLDPPPPAGDPPVTSAALGKHPAAPLLFIASVAHAWAKENDDSQRPIDPPDRAMHGPRRPCTWAPPGPSSLFLSSFYFPPPPGILSWASPCYKFARPSVFPP
jgi:hypothetical protein